MSRQRVICIDNWPLAGGEYGTRRQIENQSMAREHGRLSSWMVAASPLLTCTRYTHSTSDNGIRRFIGGLNRIFILFQMN